MIAAFEGYRRSVAAGGIFSAFAVASGLLIFGLVLYPLLNLLSGLFIIKGRLTFDAFALAFSIPDLGQILLNTLMYVGLSGAAALAIGALLAWLSERTDASLGWASSVVPLVPIFLPGLAGAIGWVLLCAPTAGLVNVVIRAVIRSDAQSGPTDIFSLTGMIVVTAIHLVPYAYLAVSAALRNLDASLEEASRMSGAGVPGTLAKIALPLVTPAIVSGGVLIFMSAVTLFTIPAILGATARFPVLSTLIYRLVSDTFPPRLAEVIVLCMMAITLIQLMLWFQVTLRFRHFQTIGAAGLRRSPVPLRGLRLPARLLILLYFALAALLPLLGLVFVSFERFWTPNITPGLLTLDNFKAVFDFNSAAQIPTAIRNSLSLGIGVAIIDLSVATLVAYYLSRSPGLMARALDVIATLPATIPHLVLGVAFLLAFNHPPLVLYGTVGLVFLAYLAIFMPQALQFAKFSFGQISPELAEASRVFGASEGRTFLRILVPLILPSAIAGGIVVTVHTINETNASVMLATVDSVIAGPTLYNLWALGNTPPVAAFATIICAVDAVFAIGSVYVGRAFSVGRSA